MPLHLRRRMHYNGFICVCYSHPFDKEIFSLSQLGFVQHDDSINLILIIDFHLPIYTKTKHLNDLFYYHRYLDSELSVIFLH